MRKTPFPKISVSIPFTAFYSALFVVADTGVFLCSFIAMMLHEAGHIAAIILCGGTVKKIEFCVFGVKTEVPELRLMQYRREIIIAAAGPLAGLLSASAAFAAAKIFGIESLDYFIGVNLVVTAINLIPVYPLDGGRIVLSFALSHIGIRGAYAISCILSSVFIGAIFAACVYLACFKTLNPSLFMFALYIAMCGIKFRPRL